MFYKYYVKSYDIERIISKRINMIQEFKSFFGAYISGYREKIINGFIEKRKSNFTISKINKKSDKTCV